MIRDPILFYSTMIVRRAYLVGNERQSVSVAHATAICCSRILVIYQCCLQIVHQKLCSV